MAHQPAELYANNELRGTPSRLSQAMTNIYSPTQKDLELKDGDGGLIFVNGKQAMPTKKEARKIRREEHNFWIQTLINWGLIKSW